MRQLATGPVLSRTVADTCVLTLNRPEVRNALDVPTRSLLIELLREADEGPCRAIVITGTDPAFCAGVDYQTIRESTSAAVQPGPNPGEAVRAVRTPVVAAVNGACVTGGLEIALSCDFIIASERAFFADTHASIGFVPQRGMWGMSALLPEAIGRRAAKELSLTGRRMPAAEALSRGLVARVAEHAALLDTALAVCGVLSKNAGETNLAWLDAYDEAAGIPLRDALAAERMRN